MIMFHPPEFYQHPLEHPLIVITGPTASGKSSLALDIAREHQGEIVCADSRQIYQELNIGTAKPSLEERAEIPHHLFDIAHPMETFTVSQYLTAAEQALSDIWQRGKRAVLVGGTGLYLKSLLYAYQIPQVPPDETLRQHLLQLETEQGSGTLHHRLAQVDPVSASLLHPHDLRRVIRALEVFETTGTPLSEQQKRSDTLRFPCLYLGLMMPRPLLEKRIIQRIAEMITQGLTTEVEYLRQKYGKTLPLLKTLNYIEIGDFIDGMCTLAQAQEAMHIHTRQYARRQINWFRKDPGIDWVECLDETRREPQKWLAQYGLACAEKKEA